MRLSDDTPTFARERRQRLTGILLMMGAVATFSCIDASSKYLNAHMSVTQVVWARYTFAFLLTLIVSNPITRPGLTRTTRPALQIGRSLLLVASTAFNVIALRYLQLDQTVSIMFSLPLIVALLSGPLLGEWIDSRRWAAIAIGFLGVVVVMRPGLGGIHPAAILSVLGTVCYGFYAIATRVLARTDETDTTLFYSNVVGCVGTSAMLPFVWTTPDSWTVVVVMVAIGFFGSLGHFLMIAAHRLAPAPILAPFVYTQIVWMATLGFVVFGDVPNEWTLLGAAIVIASGLYLLLRERRVKRRA
ncbi:MAG TPA: DMT family transporter [Xanthobacteraceae bacterium]|nr:DMT family transporter [Xanthobacteraceae bacterium]